MIHEGVSHNFPIAKKLMMKRVGNPDHANAKYLLNSVKKRFSPFRNIT
jgi:hypothetical protein